MMKKYSKEMYEFVKANIKGTRIYKMTEMVNEKFGIGITENQMKAYCSNHKLCNGLFHRAEGIRKPKLTTPEQDEFILKNYKMTPNKVLAELVNKEFGTNFTAEQMNSYKTRHHLDSGLTGYFQKGHIPKNKGKKMPLDTYKKCANTMFKKGNIPPNHKPLGTERILEKGGYIEVKVAEPNKWELKHRFIWRQHHGEIPPKARISFLDGNIYNFDINNLVMLTPGESIEMTRNKLWKQNKELTKAGVNIAKLRVAINEKKKEMRKK